MSLFHAEEDLFRFLCGEIRIQELLRFTYRNRDKDVRVFPGNGLHVVDDVLIIAAGQTVEDEREGQVCTRDIVFTDVFVIDRFSNDFHRLAEVRP